jgi:hypothetical protein
MKAKLLLIGLVMICIISLGSASFAEDYDRGGDDDCHVRLAAYVVHPFGMAAEYVITRPIHWITKQVHLNKIFGSKNTFEDTSFKWE